MPDVSSRIYRPVFLVVGGNFYSVQDSFRCDNLIRAHDKKHILGGEDAVLREDIQDGVLRKEGLGEIDEIRNGMVVCVGPVTRELERVARLSFFGRVDIIFDVIETSGVRIVFRVHPV